MFPFVFLQNKLITASPLENDIKGFNCLCILNTFKTYENKHFEIKSIFCNDRNRSVGSVQILSVRPIRSTEMGRMYLGEGVDVSGLESKPHQGRNPFRGTCGLPKRL